MADRTEEAVRKKALASEYAEKLSKRREKVRNSLTPEQYRFFGRLENVTLTPVYADFERAMKKPGTVPSEYLTSKMGWLFRDAIPGKEKEVVLYFADRLTEYPYSNSYVRRSFRSGENAAYVSKLVDGRNRGTSAYIFPTQAYCPLSDRFQKPSFSAYHPTDQARRCKSALCRRIPHPI